MCELRCVVVVGGHGSITAPHELGEGKHVVGRYYFIRSILKY